MDRYIFFVLCACSLLLLTTAQKIRQLRVPDIVNLKTSDSAILDCDYEVGSKGVEGLVVKWYFEEDPKPVYQWIPPQEPQALGILKGRLNLHYKATNETLTMHRALSIKQLSLDLSGEYKCVVSSFEEEDSMAKKMIVLEPPEKVYLYQVKADEDSVTVICSAHGTFPQPILNITYEGSPILENVDTDMTKNDDGLFNVTTLVTLKDDTLKYPTDFVCNVRIPETHYNEDVQLKYYPENAAFIMTPRIWGYLLIALLITFGLL